VVRVSACKLIKNEVGVNQIDWELQRNSTLGRPSKRVKIESCRLGRTLSHPAARCVRD